MTIGEDIERLKLQEERLRFDHFNEADAWALGSLMRKRAEAAGLPIVIDIRIAGRQLFFTSFAGASSDNAEWARRKANSVMRFHKSSYRLGRELAKSGDTLGPEKGLDVMDYAAHGGSFPIHVKGAGVIGTVTVSGVPQREDHDFVAGSLIEFLGLDPKGLMLGPEG